MNTNLQEFLLTIIFDFTLWLIVVVTYKSINDERGDDGPYSADHGGDAQPLCPDARGVQLTGVQVHHLEGQGDAHLTCHHQAHVPPGRRLSWRNNKQHY